MRVRKEVIMINMGRTKKFIRYDEEVQLYSMGICRFRQLARKVGAVYKVDKIVLVNAERSEKYPEGFAEA